MCRLAGGLATAYALRRHGPYGIDMEAAPRTGASAAAARRAATNQPDPLVGHDVVTSDLALIDAVRRLASAPDDVLGSLKDLGRLAGTAEAREHGLLANRNEPEARHVRPLRQPHRRGRLPPVLALADGPGGRVRTRRDPVDKPGSGRSPAPGRRLLRLVAGRERARLSGVDDVRRGTGPAGETRRLAAEWTSRLASTTYDFGLRPGADKDGCLAGMGMTEKQGGVRRPGQRHVGDRGSRLRLCRLRIFSTGTSGSRPRR